MNTLVRRSFSFAVVAFGLFSSAWIPVVTAQAGPTASAAVQGTPTRVAVAARPIPRGTVLTDEDITYEERAISAQSAVSAVAVGNRVVAGWIARSLIKTGEPLRPPVVAPPIVVTANQAVDVVYSDHEVNITIRGVVTKDAALGERVSVRTPGGHLDGIVVGPGRVRIE